MGSTLMRTRAIDLERQRDELHEDFTYLQSHSMRNNLVFTNIADDNSSGNETAEVTEQKLWEHMQTALKLSKDITDSIRFERVNRSPGYPITG
ncbi:hypothetical protein DPMN_081840 [Dreissena polymorpha]|uniref:Uncharacterized protein n=1 Tax=Dreissena polymorpha TaxID=45954 RepID=A0A9D3Y6M2_DREPO|nr:hypothetical protein DPMN_081840 [Dreissena polymorpha]